jgi:hypothetical protein
MASWKRVLTEADLAPNTGTVGASIADDQQGLVTGNSVFDYIAAQNFGSGAGDIQSVNQGNGIETSATDGGSAGNVASGDAFIRVKPAANGGIAVAAAGVSLASTVAGNGLTLNQGVIAVAGQSGITVTADAIEARVDDSTVEVDNSTGNIRVKNLGITFAKFSAGAICDSTETFSNVDTEVPTTKAIGLNFPNVTLTPTGNANYLTLNAGGTAGIQDITMDTIDISNDTNLNVSNTSNNQQDVDLTLTNSILTATTPGLSTSSNVQFNNITAAGTLSVSGNVVLGDAATDTVTITGDLTVQGNTTTINTSTLVVEDQLITLGSGNTAPGTASNAGIQVQTGSTATEFPEIKWKSLQSGVGLTGWHVENYRSGRTDDSDLVPIAVMDINAGAPAQSNDSAGVGALWFDTTGDELYLRVS